MQLVSLTTKNFRNLHSQTLTFHPEFNFIFGKNAQGKTNLIEAISYLSELKSFRSTHKSELICSGCDFATLKAKVLNGENDTDLAITLTHDRREILADGKSPRSHRDYHAILPTIIFEPRHIYLFRDSPSQRRQYLNRAICLLNPGQVTLLRDYDRVIAQKNRLLKDKAPVSLTEIWNQQIVELGTKIIRKRHEWINAMSEQLAIEHKALSHAQEACSLNYAPARRMNLASCNIATMTDADIKALLAQRLKDCVFEEYERREALVGPHRDDMHVLLDERNVGQLGSQGENRTVVIALKLAQLKMFAAQNGYAPLFLLDDVASELDETRREYLFSYLSQEHAQVFITTTEKPSSPKNMKPHEQTAGTSTTSLVGRNPPADRALTPIWRMKNRCLFFDVKSGFVEQENHG
jgi:DNA replication and repair protein RecF